MNKKHWYEIVKIVGALLPYQIKTRNEIINDLKKLLPGVQKYYENAVLQNHSKNNPKQPVISIGKSTFISTDGNNLILKTKTREYSFNDLIGLLRKLKESRGEYSDREAKSIPSDDETPWKHKLHPAKGDKKVKLKGMGRKKIGQWKLI